MAQNEATKEEKGSPMDGIEYNLQGIKRDPVLRSIFCMMNEYRNKRIEEGESADDVDKLFEPAFNKLSIGNIGTCENCGKDITLGDFFENPFRLTCKDLDSCKKNVINNDNESLLRCTLINTAKTLLSQLCDSVPDEPLSLFRGGDGLESEGKIVSHSQNLVDVTRKDSAIETIAECIRAIEKINEGTYGECDECEEAISVVRMHTYPYSILCIHCKGEREKQNKHLRILGNQCPRQGVSITTIKHQLNQIAHA